MPRSIIVSSPIVQSPRVLQLSGMFDVPPSERSELSWDVDLPLDEKPWNIGLIVGPSGAGKSTVARALFGDKLTERFDWPTDKSVVDAFPKGMPVKTIVSYMTSVGFSSPPSWLRPFHALSNGEQFRVTIARALAETSELVVIDEFTSVVDRQVAQIASNSVQKTVRREGRQFVAVTCHYDVIDWLQPDWVYQPHVNEFQWRSLQCRPQLKLEVYPIDRAAWRVFKHHHYMSADLSSAAQCFGGFINGECVAFTSYLHFPHPKRKNIKMGHRLVVLPDYQGLGIGGRLDDWLGLHLYKQGFEYRNVVAHPAMIAYYTKSPRWKLDRTGFGVAAGKHANKSIHKHNAAVTIRRITSSFVYVPSKESLNA